MIAEQEIQMWLPDTSRYEGLCMTFEEFLNWDEGYAEWANGKIVLLNFPTSVHQEIMGFLNAVMTTYASKHNAGRTFLCMSLIRMANSARHPSYMFLAEEHLSRLKEYYVEGCADVIVEILGRATRPNDDEVKFREYEEAGVREYWQIDPATRQAKFYRRGENGKFRLVALQEETFVSDALPGFKLKTEWLWDNPLARVAEVLREIGAV